MPHRRPAGAGGGAAVGGGATVVLARAARTFPAEPAELAVPAEPAVPYAGILPPRNPPANLPPDPSFWRYCRGGALDDSSGCNSKVLQAIDNARKTEPVGPLEVNLARLLKLSVPDQLFAIADLERVSRGEPPMTALTTQLDTLAQAGADADRDPSFPASLTGGAELRAGGSNWAGGTESALGSDDGWMYDDGYGSANEDCKTRASAGCWGHRDNILGLYAQDLAGCPSGQSQLVMGAAYTPAGGTSFAEIFIAACGAKPADEVYTWAEAQAAIGITPVSPPEVGIAPTPEGNGYFVVSSAGKVSVYGHARSAGDLSGTSLAAPVVAVAVDDANGGYWLVGANGEVSPFGHAPWYGDLRHDRLTKPVVAVAVDQATGGYWLATSNGAVFSFHAPYHGAASRRKLPAPIVAMIADPVAAGYWLVGADGSVYPFGNVRSRGSLAGRRLPGAIVGAAVTWDGFGYWLAGSNGSVYNLGDAPFKGSESREHLRVPVTAVAATPTAMTPASAGYWLLEAGGVIYRFDAP